MEVSIRGAHDLLNCSPSMEPWEIIVAKIGLEVSAGFNSWWLALFFIWSLFLYFSHIPLQVGREEFKGRKERVNDANYTL